jgi:hypothetical protein
LKKSRRLRFNGSIKTRRHNLVASGFVRTLALVRGDDIQQITRDAGIGEMSGNSRSHGSRTQNGSLMNALVHDSWTFVVGLHLRRFCANLNGISDRYITHRENLQEQRKSGETHGKLAER